MPISTMILHITIVSSIIFSCLRTFFSFFQKWDIFILFKVILLVITSLFLLLLLSFDFAVVLFIHSWCNILAHNVYDVSNFRRRENMNGTPSIKFPQKTCYYLVKNCFLCILKIFNSRIQQYLKVQTGDNATIFIKIQMSCICVFRKKN